ncbi:MAG: DUF6128 domain-containing protein [Lachnospiraceae bacterium]
MSEIRKFVTYIYQYEKAVRRYNVGFSRIEIRDQQCRMQIQIKMNLHSARTIPFYLCVRRGTEIVGVKGEEIEAASTGIAKVFLLDAEHIYGSNYSMADVIGIRFGDGDNYLGSIWVDDVSGLILDQVDSDKEEQEESIEEPELLQQPEEEPEPSPQITAQEIVAERKSSTELFANSSYRMEELNGKQIRCYEIRLNEIKYLPQEYWYLGNNNFLLHGFFQYGYLLYGESQDETIHLVGVPGVFQNQENVAASIFGFPEFLPEKKNQQLTGQFGYWYRCQEE